MGSGITRGTIKVFILIKLNREVKDIILWESEEISVRHSYTSVSNIRCGTSASFKQLWLSKALPNVFTLA